MGLGMLVVGAVAAVLVCRARRRRPLGIMVPEWDSSIEGGLDDSVAEATGREVAPEVRTRSPGVAHELPGDERFV